MNPKAMLSGLTGQVAKPWFPLVILVLSTLNVFIVFLSGGVTALFVSTCAARGRKGFMVAAVCNALGALLGTAAASGRRVRAPPPASKATGRRAASRVSIRELVAAVEGGGGVCHPGYDVQAVEGCGDGVVAQVPIPEGAAIVDLPIELCAVSSAAEGEGGGSAGVQLVRILLDQLLRQGQASPLATYLRSLPRTFSEPAFWRPGCDEMLALAGSRLAVSIAADQRAADHGAAALVAADAHIPLGGDEADRVLLENVRHRSRLIHWEARLQGDPRGRQARF